MSDSREAREKRLFDLLRAKPSSEQAFSFPLSSAQRGIWLTYELNPDSPAYNLPLALHLKGPLDSQALASSLDELLKRHDILRTRGQYEQGDLTQRIRPWQPFDLEFVDLSHLAAEAALRAGHEQARTAGRRPFDLRDDLLLRATLFYLGPDEHLFFLNTHHFVTDGIARRRLFRELVTLYRALTAGQPLPTAQETPYAEFVTWQQRWLGSADAQKQADFWVEWVADFPQTLELPTDRRLRPNDPTAGAVAHRHMSVELNASLRQLARQEGVTLFTVLEAGVQVLLQRYLGQDRFLLATTTSVRPNIRFEHSAGTFANNILLPAEPDSDQSVRELLRQTGQTLRAALDNSYFPFDALVQRLQPACPAGRNVLFQVNVLIHRADMQSIMDLPGLSVEELRLDLGTSRLDLGFEFVETVHRLRLDLEYNTQMFDPDRIERLLNHLEVVLSGMVADPDQRVGHLPLLTSTERTQILSEWNHSNDSGLAQETLHGAVESQVDRTSDLPAVIFGDLNWSYRELDRAANQIAHRLLKAGIGRGDVVPILMTPCLERVAAVLGV